MEHTATIDLAALEAEVAALELVGAEQDARLAELLAPRRPALTIRQQMDAMWTALAQGSAELNQIERDQVEIGAALDALGVD